MSINNFIANFKNGARPNRFKVQLAWPALVGTPDVRDEFVVSAATLPSSTLGIIQIPYMGRQIPVPGDRTFEDWTISILNDKSFSHRNAFERWSNLILSHESNVQGTETYRDLITTLTVFQLDRSEKVLKTYKLYNAWPNTITPIDLGYDQNDTIEQYTVTFSYTHWESPTSVVS